MATGSGKSKLLFMPTTLPGPAATPTVLSAPTAAAGPGKDITLGMAGTYWCPEINGLKIHYDMIQQDK